MAKLSDTVVLKPILMLIVVFAVLVWFLYGVKSILAPFVFSLVIAYLFAPLVSYLDKLRLSRTFSTMLVMSLLLMFIIIVSLTTVPILYKQISLLVNKVVEQKELIINIMPLLSAWLEKLDPYIVSKIKIAFSGLSHEILTFAGSVLKDILQSGMQTINIISLIFIAPIVLFYTLRDWNKITTSIQLLVPKKYTPVAKKLFNEIDHALSGYVRGQTLVCIFLGLFYASGLALIGLDSACALGLISGLLSFIPYAGAIFSCVLCMLISLLQFGVVEPVLFTIVLFIVGQFLEGHFIVPRFIGKSVNLHPVWIMFGLLAGGALMGFIGVLIALPLTAIVGVVIRFVLSYYYKSKIYN